MTDSIDPAALAVSLMREALSLLDEEETEAAVQYLKRAIEAVPLSPLPDDRDEMPGEDLPRA